MTQFYPPSIFILPHQHSPQGLTTGTVSIFR